MYTCTLYIKLTYMYIFYLPHSAPCEVSVFGGVSRCGRHPQFPQLSLVLWLYSEHRMHQCDQYQHCVCVCVNVISIITRTCIGIHIQQLLQRITQCYDSCCYRKFMVHVHVCRHTYIVFSAYPPPPSPSPTGVQS